MGEFNIHKLDITIDDAIHFLIRSYRSEASSRKFHEVKNFMEKMVMKELGLDISKLLDVHEIKMDELENDYD